ncbi:hypothetical protein BDR05DRAFT_951015 [Suillus weaverae]|nr:hypothetical protein BDR05DRAFT_951015 [Suillus weaverae]
MASLMGRVAEDLDHIPQTYQPLTILPATYMSTPRMSWWEAAVNKSTDLFLYQYPQGLCLTTIMPSNTSSRQRVVHDVPIIRQTGLNIAGHLVVYLYRGHCISPGSPLMLQDLIKYIDLLHLSDIALHYRMVYAYAPLCGAKHSHQEFTDGVVYRPNYRNTEIGDMPLSTTSVRPPRESLAANSDTTPTVTTPNVSTSTTIATRRMDVVHEALIEACSFVIDNGTLPVNHGIRLWIDDNMNTLYKSVVMPMSTILNRFKKCVQDLVENVYGLDTSIWTNETVCANHNKMTVDFLIRQGSLNFIFGDILENGHEIHYPFEHKAITQITVRAAFHNGYHKFIDSDESLDNIMSMSAAAACCSLQEFATAPPTSDVVSIFVLQMKGSWTSVLLSSILLRVLPDTAFGCTSIIYSTHGPDPLSFRPTPASFRAPTLHSLPVFISTRLALGCLVVSYSTLFCAALSSNRLGTPLPSLRGPRIAG